MAKRGYPKISEWFPDLSDAIQEKVKAELMEGAQRIKAAAEANINAQFIKRSGRLETGVFIKPTKAGTTVYVGAKAINPKDKVNYASVLEFSPHKHGHPFLLPAYYAHKDEIHQKILDAVREGVQNFNER